MKKYLILILFIIFVNFSINASFAAELILPDWIFVVHDFFIDEKISYTEFGTMIEYLQKHEIVQLIMGEDYDPVTNFLITSSMQQESLLNEFHDCSSDWYITGYFTPVETDYSGNFLKIMLDGEPQYFKSDFISVVKTEGWGKTRMGTYIGWYDESFHLSTAPLDSHGDNLLVQSVAVDSEIINQKTSLIIPKLPSPWNKIIFESSDIGPSIKGKHIDVYVGEGKYAELETFRITNSGNDVCIRSSDN
ncbi:3D domain-containing protein [Nitrosopumilus sp.]|uniref:3D domain-containing protein n=1 Tax=Nitrosopumilus sp. TaxID=2024843 RepID=UPI00247ED1F2|nr:3D domain-containing protein [Nitrosopumilus sp.]MCV0409959.1 hypothetical protein [Nitrosopumilus sp.]